MKKTKDQLIEEAKKLLTQLMQSQEEGDLSLLESCFLHTEELVTIGADLDKVWYGWEEYSRFIKTAIERRKGHTVTERNTSIYINDDGTCAWYSQLIDTCLETKGEPFRLEGFRHTGVLVRRNDRWQIAQSHTSVPVVLPHATEE